MTKKINNKELKKFIETQSDFIMNLLELCQVPDRKEDDSYMDYLLPDSQAPEKDTNTEKKQTPEQLGELEDRMNTIRNKMKAKKRPMTERAQKKRETKKLKKNKEFKKVLVSAAKSMKNEQNKHNETVEKEDKKNIEPVPVKPVFNEEGKIVFSKFDLSAHPGAKSKKSHQNPREILKKINETNKKLKELKESGEEQKAAELHNELAWKKAFDKIEGKKVKDDPKLLVKAIKKRKVQKKKSKQKWTERKTKVADDISERQKKRNMNISKRIQDKKNKTLKRLSKKGRIVPGF